MLHLTEAIATLSHVNLRIEKVGKKGVRPAADLKFTVNIPNTQLDDISSGLLASLYRRADEKHHQGDLTAADPQAMTTLRHPRAKPWASTEDWPGYFTGIAAGEFELKDFEINKGVLKSVVCEAKNGGTVELTFSIGCNPQPADVAILYELMGKEVGLTLAPPSLGDLEKLRAEAKNTAEGSGIGPGAGGDGDDDKSGDAEPGPATDAQAGRAFPDALDGRGAKPARRGNRGETLQ